MSNNSVYDGNRDFTSLDAWKRARDLKMFCYIKIIPRLPDFEKYGLASQIRRASVSTTANISEGYGRYHYKDGIRFYYISRGSIYELKDHLISCFELKFISQDLLEEGLRLVELAKRSLNGYISFVQRRILNKIP
jgi:four helix bundle protein